MRVKSLKFIVIKSEVLEFWNIEYEKKARYQIK